MSTIHTPVLLAETIALLALHPGAVCVDGTLGGGGHAEAMLEAAAPDGRLLGLDVDPMAIERCALRLERFGTQAMLRQSSFRHLARVAAEAGVVGADAVVLDLGLSSDQLATGSRGFSLLADGPLDMRMDPGSPLTAAAIVNEWPQDSLADMLYRYGEEHRSRRIAEAIVKARPLTSTVALAEVIGRAVGGRRGERIHPATRSFQALRIAVNDELGALEDVLPQIVGLLSPGGRVAFITFHSLEDRIVKQYIQREARDCICDLDPRTRRMSRETICTCGHRASLRRVTIKALQPSAQEIRLNSRSRSARLRVAERLAEHV